MSCPDIILHLDALNQSEFCIAVMLALLAALELTLLLKSMRPHRQPLPLAIHLTSLLYLLLFIARKALSIAAYYQVLHQDLSAATTTASWFQLVKLADSALLAASCLGVAHYCHSNIDRLLGIATCYSSLFKKSILLLTVLTASALLSQVILLFIQGRIAEALFFDGIQSLTILGCAGLQVLVWACRMHNDCRLALLQISQPFKNRVKEISLMMSFSVMVLLVFRPLRNWFAGQFRLVGSDCMSEGSTFANVIFFLGIFGHMLPPIAVVVLLQEGLHMFQSEPLLACQADLAGSGD